MLPRQLGVERIDLYQLHLAPAPNVLDEYMDAMAEAVRAGNVDSLLADLSSQQEICRLAGEFKSKYSQLHILINNAGAMFLERQLTVDGIEMTFALNHLAYFLLTNLLLDAIKASARRGSSMFRRRRR